jgi:hypothetical protein
MNATPHISAAEPTVPAREMPAKAADKISAKQAAALLQFLQRTQMQGAEMPVYVDVFNSLSAIAATENSQGTPK